MQADLFHRDCDSPMTLVDLTFEWLKKEWVDEIDFVVWTGDSARYVLFMARCRRCTRGVGAPDARRLRHLAYRIASLHLQSCGGRVVCLPLVRCLC